MTEDRPRLATRTRIGIDFDNTIAGFDEVFAEAACRMVQELAQDAVRRAMGDKS